MSTSENGEDRKPVSDETVERCYQHVSRATSCYGPEIRLVVEVALGWAAGQFGGTSQPGADDA